MEYSVKKYICKECKKEYIKETSYKKHMNIKHSDEVLGLRPRCLKLTSENKKILFPKPILKWVGGKTQIIEKIISNFPVHMNNYHEIFLGGGSVLLTVLQYKKNGIITIGGNIYASDVNQPLIYVYKNIQSNHILLYEEIQILINIYKECTVSPSCGNEINRKPKTFLEATQSKENYYYWIRQQYNILTDKTSILCSAMFIFLNKTCFRGVFRIGPNGFNVPYGHYKNPEIINEEHLLEIHTLIQEVIFNVSDFNTSLSCVTHIDDFVYLDPPYVPEKLNSFVGYSEHGFDKKEHIKLFSKFLVPPASGSGEATEPLADEIRDDRADSERVEQLPEGTSRVAKFTPLTVQPDFISDTSSVEKITTPLCNILQNKIMMSNSDTELVRQYFSIDRYNIETILCKRTINSKNPKATTQEIIIKNY